ncbi:unnamed protein product [Anisakis simplex]|uniref:RNA-directed DNA polymerase, eukaryota, reverse transcriptase zinc-binding domain protein n=1 Tax=Anisakis simplex TaxID=6269 RepID=A0A0M3JV31_ANISI|nr:unnamed protein product [Anisakis simplex]
MNDVYMWSCAECTNLDLFESWPDEVMKDLRRKTMFKDIRTAGFWEKWGTLAVSHVKKKIFCCSSNLNQRNRFDSIDRFFDPIIH